MRRCDGCDNPRGDKRWHDQWTGTDLCWACVNKPENIKEAEDITELVTKLMDQKGRCRNETIQNNM